MGARIKVRQGRRCHLVAAALFLPLAAAAGARRQNLPPGVALPGSARVLIGMVVNKIRHLRFVSRLA